MKKSVRKVKKWVDLKENTLKLLATRDVMLPDLIPSSDEKLKAWVFLVLGMAFEIWKRIKRQTAENKLMLPEFNSL